MEGIGHNQGNICGILKVETINLGSGLNGKYESRETLKIKYFLSLIWIGNDFFGRWGKCQIKYLAAFSLVILVLLESWEGLLVHMFEKTDMNTFESFC